MLFGETVCRRVYVEMYCKLYVAVERIEMIDENYLICINQKCNKLRSEFKYSEITEANCSITYLPTKKTSFLGYKRGYYEQVQLQINGLKETNKLRPNCKNYLKIFHNNDGKIVQIQNIKNCKVVCIHQVLYEKDIVYMFPFSNTGAYYPTYSYVSKINGEFIEEEYMVNSNQIIYERYERQNEKVRYESVNYVINGKYPVLSKECGVFSFGPLEYKVLSEYSWLDERDK